VQGTGDLGQPLYQAYQITVDPNQPLAIVLPSEGSTLAPGMVGAAFAFVFALGGGAAPYTWSVVNTISELPPGLTLGTTAPGFNNVLTGKPTKAGTFSFPMQVQDSQDNTATGTVTITVNPWHQ
jgi:large repetitive protein